MIEDDGRLQVCSFIFSPSMPLLVSLQVSGPSFLLWVSENYKELCKLAEELTAKEVLNMAWQNDDVMWI
jgi:hypothetical protein